MLIKRPIFFFHKNNDPGHKKKSLLFLFGFLSFLLSAQNTRVSECIPKPDLLDGQKVYRLASKLAQFPGGEMKMLQFIQDNFKHAAGKKQIMKTLVVTFVVDSAGKVRNPCLLKTEGKSVDDAAGKELIKVFERMPNWEAALLNGKKSYMRIVMPVQLVLD
jgi:hypothetical protein